MSQLSREYQLDGEMTFDYSAESLGQEVKDEDAQLRELEAVAASIQNQRIEIEAQGKVSRQDAMALESLVPNSLPDRYRPNSFTMQPTATNLKVMLESNDQAQRGVVARFFVTAWSLLVKIGKWILGLFRSSKNLDNDSGTATAQALTVSKIVADLGSKNILLANTSVQQLLEEAFVDKLAPQLSLLNVYLYDPNRGTEELTSYCNFVDEVSEAIIGRTLGYKGVLDDADKYLDIVDTTLRHSSGAGVKEPALLFRVAAAYKNLMSSGHRPSSARFNERLSKAVAGTVAQVNVQSAEYLAERDGAYNTLAYLVRTGYEDDQSVRPSMLELQNWLNPEYVLRLESFCRRGMVILRVDPAYDKKLDGLVKRLEGFKNQSLKSMDNLDDEGVEAFRKALRATQNDFMVLSKIIGLLREQQERNIRLMSTIERGMNKVITDIYKLVPKEQASEVKAVVEAHRKAHADLVKRMTDKGYV